MASDLEQRLKKAEQSWSMSPEYRRLFADVRQALSFLEQQVEDLRAGSASSETRLDAPSAPSAGAELPDPDEGHDPDATCLQVRS